MLTEQLRQEMKLFNRLLSATLLLTLLTFTFSAEGSNRQKEKFKLLLHTQMSGDYDTSKKAVGEQFGFNVKQLRLEIQGQLSRNVSYRWRQRINESASNKGSSDFLPPSIDIAAFTFDLDNGLSFTLGRQITAFGGMEYNLNPINVYQFSDMVGSAPCFLTGVGMQYMPSDQHLFTLQVLNGNNYKYEIAFPNATAKPTNFPLLYTINWAGRIAPFWETNWSYSYQTQAVDKAMHYVALGNGFKLGPILIDFDYLFSKEGLDSKRLMSHPTATVNDVMYNSLVGKVRVPLNRQWLIFTKGMYEKGERVSPEKVLANETSSRTSYSILGGIEYKPFRKSDLYFFMTYINRNVEQTINSQIHTSNHYRVSTGVVYTIPLVSKKKSFLNLF